MPIFDNELVNNISDRNYESPVDRPLGSPAFDEINGLQNLGIPGQFNESYGGITAEEARNFKSPNGPMTPNSPFSMVSKSELLANQRYPLYERGVDLENIYGLQQSGLEQLGNGLVKMGAFALGTFGQSFATIPNTFSAIKNGKFSELSNPDGYEATIDNWTKNLEDYFPNYVTRYEQSRGLATAIPFTYGSANFWGDKILKNTGFMVGAIGGALVQDAIIGAATEGIGAVPLVAAQLGKASLYLNKLFTGTNRVDKVLDLARAAGKSEQALLNIERLGQLAAAQKLNSGFRYTMSVYGSARTEAAIEARESYETISKQLIEDYTLEKGFAPTGQDLQEIENYATDAMNTRFGINMALLTVSNAVQFDNLFKTFTSAQKGITSSTVRNFEDAGKLGLKEGSLDVFERKVPATFTGKVWDIAKPRAANIITEGVYEEGGQFATQVGVEDYYTRKYKNKESWNFVKEAMTSTTKGMAEQFGSSEGIESMIVGGITAALTGEAMSLVDRAKGRGKNKRLESAINIMNQYGMTGILSEKYQDTSRGLEIARQMQDAVASNNIFKYKNLKSDMLFNFVKSRLPIGMHDVTIEQLNMLKELPKEEFEKTFGMDFSTSNKETVAQYVDSIIAKVNQIKDTVDGVNSMFNNPYRRIVDPKTDEEKLENAKYTTFENFKTDVSALSVIQQDVDSRLFDIQTSVSQVNPLVSNDLISTLTNSKGIKELSDSYEQKANSLSESLTTIEPSKRTRVREEIKKLRTLSEKISMALSSGNVDPSLFNTLLNFELNNQDFSKSNVVGLDKSQKLITFSEDINKLKERKRKAEEAFDYLNTEEGFNKYFKQEEELQKETIDVDYVDISNKHKFINKNNKEEELTVGREYQIPGFSPAKVRKTGEQYKVTSPTGEVKYYDTREEAKQAADDLNVDFSELTTVKVIALNDDGTIKVEDLSGNIQNIDSSRLKGYEKLQTEEEKLAKDKEVLDKQLEELEQGSGTVVTVSSDKPRIIGDEDKRKDVDRLFLATTTPTEADPSTINEETPHIKRSRRFLNNVKFFNNKEGEYKVIIVTPNNAKELGLDGIVQLSYKKPITDELTEEETNVDLGFMAQVFVLQTPEGEFFVNEKGEKLSKVGEKNPTILDNVIFQTMTSASLTTTGGAVKHRAGQEEEAEKALEAYKIFRQELFAQKGYDVYDFAVSRGIPNVPIINGQRQNNPISGILGPNADNIITNREGLLKVVTTGKVEHDGELLSFPVGTTLIQYKDLLDFANNRKLTNNQANVIFKLVEEIANDIIKQSNLDKPVKINFPYFDFLRNVLYMRSKGDTKSPSQIGIDTTNMTFNISGKSFPFSKISSSKQEILDILQDAFISVNNKTLSEKFNNAFTEYRLDKEENIVSVKWPNYQTYLLSDKNPDGSKRAIAEIPLITHSAIETENTNSYKQKYAYITDKNVLPYEKVPAKEVKVATNPIQQNNKIGKYEVNTDTPQTYSAEAGPVLFTATFSEGVFDVTVLKNDTIESIATNPIKIKGIDAYLKKGQSDEYIKLIDTKLNEDKVKLYLETAVIPLELKKELEAQRTTPAPVQEAPAVEEVVQPIAPPEVVAQQDLKTRKSELDKLSGRNDLDYSDYGYVHNERQGISSLTKSMGDGKYLYRKSKIDIINKFKEYFEELSDKILKEFNLKNLEEGVNEINSVQHKKLLNSYNKKYEKRDVHNNREGNEKILMNSDEIRAYHLNNKINELLTEKDVIENPDKYIKFAIQDPKKVSNHIIIDEDKFNEINAKYDAELDALEEAKPVEDLSNISFEDEDGPSEYRKVGKDVTDRMTNSDLEEFVKWHTETVPFIPFEVLEQMVQVNDNEQAWGVFEDGVAKFVKGGLRGTEYHEIGHGIWTMLPASEQEALLNEFRSKSGVFTDRASGKEITYIDATDKQAEERIWDDFSDYRLGKLPARSLGERVRRLFKMVMDFFKSFVTKPSLKEELFKQIDKGRFKETKLPEKVKTMAPKYRAIEGLSEQQTNEFIQDMAARIKMIIFGEGRKDLLFNPEKLTGEEVLGKLKTSYESKGMVTKLGEKRYNELVKRSTEFLRTIGLSIDADQVVSINNEDANNREYTKDPFSTDWKSYTSGALRFMLSTMTERMPLNQTRVSKGKELKISKENKNNSIKGYKILNFSRVFATLLDRLHNINDVNVFAEKLIQLAKEDSNYLPLFRMLGGNRETHSFDFDKFGTNDWRLFIQFFNTFTRQKPEALIQYASEEGDVYTGPANLFTTVNQTVDNWIANMKAIGKSSEGIINYANKVYTINTAAIKAIPIKKSEDQINFLNKLGIEFNQGTYDALSNKETIVNGKRSSEVSRFTDAVQRIYTQLGTNNELMTFDAKRLEINGPLRTLATLYTKVNNPNQDSTYFGVEGQRIGTFSENNAPSYFEDDFNESATLDELLTKRPELNDVFSRGSQVLKKGGLFFDKDGNRIAEIKVEYIQGSKNEWRGKNKTTAKLTEAERFVQEINQNIKGKYYVLVPGDSSTEWMMNLGNVISMEEILEGKHWNKVYNIYNGYLTDEINLALEDRKQNLYTKSNAQELRFMKDLLPESIVNGIESRIQEGATFEKIQEYVSENRDKINASIKETFEAINEETIDILLESKKIYLKEDGTYDLLTFEFDTEFLKNYGLFSDKITREQLEGFISFVNLNYEINNIEYHKFIFGDPYQFKTAKGKLDETKRIKSFLSPRRRTFDHPEYNNKLKEIYNNVDGIELDANTPGYHEYKSYVNTVTFDDVNIVGSLANINPEYVKVNETDAVSWIMDNTHKEVALKEGQWTDQAEAFHQWHMAYTRRAFDKKGIKKYTNEALRKHDDALLSKPMPKHKLAVRKPIISGNKANKNKIDLVLDKTSQTPLYYHMVEGTSFEDMYIQMFNEKVGYGIVISGRKVGAENLHPMYVDGKYNSSKFENIIEIPWKAYGTQVETMSEGEKQQTRGSQLTKLSSMDLFDNGEPISEQANKAYQRNKKALNMLNENAYNELLNRLGIEDLGTEFTLVDGTKVSETLMYEMMRRELSENAKDTIQIDDNTGEFTIPFEASPSYVQIKNILYSMINNTLVSPKMNGAPHVQIPVTGFEKATEGRDFAIKTEDGWKKLTRKEYDALTEEQKQKAVLTDSTLKFYTPEEPYTEIMLPNWFAKDLRKGKFKNYTDEQLITYLNGTTDGKKILSGIAFRIPTQALSSAEVFRVKAFLPEYMGYTVMVPSEITTKAGSDFDIDKLNMYLKSVYVDENGELKLVKYQGSEEATKQFYSNVWENTIQKDIDRIEKYDEFRSKAIDVLIIVERANQEGISNIGELMTNDQIDFFNYHFTLLQEMIDQATENNLSPSDYIVKQQETLDENKNELIIKQFNEQLKSDYVKKMYKKSLENEYYDSLEELLTLPENFNRLISPVNDGGLEKISEILDEARGYSEGNVKAKLINRNYMTRLRHSFITGKRWVGIAAVNITNLSLRQKSKVYLDPSKLSLLDASSRKFVKDLNIILPHNTVNVNGANLVSLSGTKTADGEQFLSDRMSGYATAFVDIANNPFITKIIKSDIIVSTFMFLESIGAGNTGVFFLNQPIIEQYLEYLDSIGSKSVTNSKNLQYIKSKFPTTEKALKESSISVEDLLTNIKQYSKEGKFDAAKNAEQQLILNEFIKYKVLADQLFNYTQATNYDTTRFGSSDILLKKEWATFNAANFNLISNVEDVLNKTFIGRQADLLSKAFESIGAIMKTEDPKIKAYTIDVLKKYATKKFMSMDDYMTIASGIKASFIDFIIQNGTTIQDAIAPLLLDGPTSITTKLEQAKLKYPSIQILQDLVPVVGTRDGGALSIKLKVNSKTAYDENLYTGMMRELRDSKEEDLRQLYKDIVNVAILQGTAQSAISIKNIIPVEDYAAIVGPIIQQVKPNTSLDAFANGMFERNNFSNKDVFKEFTPFANLSMSEKDEIINPNTGDTEILYYIPGFKSLGGNTRGILTLTDKYNSFDLDNDYLRVPKVITAFNGKKVNILTRREITSRDYALMKKKGSQDLYDSFYYKKVYTDVLDQFGNPIPLTTYNPKTETTEYYYKLVNVYGDGNRAVEMNTDLTPSIFNNGSIPVKQELTDREIQNYYSSVQSSPTQTPTQISRIENEVVSLPTEVVIQPTQPVIEQVTEVSEENLFTTKINQFTYSYNPSTQEVIHNSKTGDKIETNETQIGKVLAEYAKTNNLPTQSFNNQNYSKVGDRVVNINNGSIVTQKQILDLFQEEANLPILENQINKPSIFESRNVQIDYTQGQRKALTDIANLIDKGGDGYYLLAGYAGTGKTTIAENIAKYGTQSGKSIAVLAPTNKAAKVLNDKLKSTGVSSQPTTIHKAIYGEPDPDTGEWIAKSDIKNSVIIVDESSMIAKEVMEDLLRLTKNKNNTIIFMGDGFQLEPVGEDAGLFKGKVKEVNNSKSELTEVKRQSLDSDILKVATVIRNDKVAYVPETSTEDFKITNSKNEFIQNFKQSVKSNEDVAMIVATNAERILMNKLAREAKFGKDVENVINPNETIISIANSSEYSNSELFNVKDLRGEPSKYLITFTDNYGKESRYDIYLAYIVNNENKEIPILLLPGIDKPSVYHAQVLKAARENNRDLYNALSGWISTTNRGVEKLSPALTIGTYGYAITAHKSQGSQWEKVFVNQNYSAPGSDSARWFYTAITRAAKEVEVFPTRVNTTIKNSEIDAKLSNIVTENLISLKDGNQYSPEQINSTMLEQMGYNPEEIGKILKSIC